MFATFAFTMLILLAAALIYAATKPDTFYVERSIAIRATPEKIFEFINDFHLWDIWTPYNKDPAMKNTFSGSASDKGLNLFSCVNHIGGTRNGKSQHLSQFSA